MSKDDKDTNTIDAFPDTIDAFPKKRGRPVINPETGPMTPIQRYRRYTEGKVILQLRVTASTRQKLNNICKKNKVNRADQLTDWVNKNA